jgi:hypothetical protein
MNEIKRAHKFELIKNHEKKAIIIRGRTKITLRSDKKHWGELRNAIPKDEKSPAIIHPEIYNE